MSELQERLNALIGQAEDVFEHFQAKPVFEVKTINNPFGGNPETHVGFTYTTKHFNGKPKLFSYRPASQTVDEFINEIRAYMFDCVDAFVNLM